MDSAAAAVVQDGRVVAAIEEERLSRVKNEGGFPVRAITQVLETAGLSLQDVDVVCVYWQPWRVFTRASGVLKSLVSPRVFAKRARSVMTALGIQEDRIAYPELRGKWSDLFRVRRKLEAEFGKFDADIRFFDHHDCHYHSVCHLCDWDQFFSLTYDGGGEEHSTVLSHVNAGKKTTLKKIAWPNSLGHFYSAFTGFLGFRMLEGEYKMMGLAPYGKPVHKDLILAEVLKLRANGEYVLDDRLLNYHLALDGTFSSTLEKMFGPARKSTDEFTDHHRDVACSVQAAFVEALAHMIQWARAKHPDTKKMVLAGGCALNVSANGALLQSDLLDEIVIPSAPHDAGCALGAAVMGFLEKRNVVDGTHQVDIGSPYLGPSYTDDEIGAAFAEYAAAIPTTIATEEVIRRAADFLADGQVLCWFQGRTEFGPRSLGARSFLADPRSSSIREEMNARIKKRELFRPFAPSCLEECVSEFFEMDQLSPYMNIVAKVRVDKRDVIPAVTHVDGTARVHTVSRDQNRLYWELIEAFRQRTGVGVLLNTSFNIQEPIVNTPSDAIRTFLQSSVDWLVIGNRIVDVRWKQTAAEI